MKKIYETIQKIIFFHLGVSLGKHQYAMNKHIQGGLNIIYTVVFVFFAMNIYLERYQVSLVLALVLIFLSMFGSRFVFIQQE